MKASKVYFDCPYCGYCNKLQSKISFDSTLYDPTTAPKEVLKEMKKRGPINREWCKRIYTFKTFNVRAWETKAC